MLKFAAALIAGLLTMGGWAVVTVKDLPEYFVAGQQYTIEFQVRQHGRHLLEDLRPGLVVSTSERRLGGLIGGKDQVKIPAVARPVEGTYAVMFTAPAAERVFLTITSGFGNTELRLYPQPVVAAGAPRAAMAAADRGQVLFVAKGCNVCHSNTDLRNRPENDVLTVGPELGGRRLARRYVLQVLSKPWSDNMPNLELSDAEALAITAFLTSGTTALDGSRF